MATRIFENVTAFLDTAAPGVLNRKTGQVEFLAAPPPPKSVPVAKPKPAPVAPPTVEQRLAALASTIYSAPRVAAKVAEAQQRFSLNPNSVYEFRRQQVAERRDFAVDTPSPAGSGDLGRLAESIYETRMKQACGTR